MGRKVLKNDAEVKNSQALWPLEPEGLLCRILELVEEYAQRAFSEVDHDTCVEYLMAARILLKLLKPFGEVRIKVEFLRKDIMESLHTELPLIRKGDHRPSREEVVMRRDS